MTKVLPLDKGITLKITFLLSLTAVRS